MKILAVLSVLPKMNSTNSSFLVDTYSSFVSSQLDNTTINKFMGKCTSTMNYKDEDYQQFFRNLSFLQKYNSSFVVETDSKVIKFLLNEATRKFICDTFKYIRIIHVINIPDYTSVFGSAQLTTKDSYLICSRSVGYFGTQSDVVEFSTYDMSKNSTTQLNQITLSSMSEYNYSFDHSDYYFDKPTKPTLLMKQKISDTKRKEMNEFIQNSVKRGRISIQQ